MSVKSILDFMDRVTDAVKEFAPIAAQFGVPFAEKVAGMADTAVDIAENVLERAEDAKVVLTSQDEQEIAAKIASLRQTNNQLAEFIRNNP